MLENIRISIQGIWSHKMRSFLTMLGIIIGIASIIAIVSTLKGTNEQIKEDLIGAGNNTVSITLNYGDSAYDQEYGMGDGTAAPLLSDEQKEEVRKLDHIEDATFFYSRSYASNVYYQNTSFQGGSIYGIDMNYLETRGYMVRSGRGFIQKDFSEMRKVVLVDDNAAENLFAGENPVEILTKYIDRVGHIHVKDVRREVFEQVKNGDHSFLWGVKNGMFTVPGDGNCVDWDQIFNILKSSDYEGWIVVEAEQDPAKADPLEYAQKARAFMRTQLGV